jgi:hypothetical protein
MVETENNLAPTMRKTVCYDCKQEFEYEAILLKGKEVFRRTFCPACETKFRTTAITGSEINPADIALVKAQREWELICPPLYRETELPRLPIDREVLDRILRWEPGKTGLGLSGPSGAGKTRAMFLLLEKHHFAGRRIRAFSAKKFENWCHKKFEKDDDAKVRIEEARRASIVFIDDIGKEKYTDRVESEFYDLIEHRTSHLLPILWTANATGQQLEQMMGPDRGVPIVRRLREFTEIISV